MQATARNCKQIMVDTFPKDGTFRGTWGGYVVKFHVDGMLYQCDMNNGIRTTDAACTVTVVGDKITVETDAP